MISQNFLRRGKKAAQPVFTALDIDFDAESDRLYGVQAFTSTRTPSPAPLLQSSLIPGQLTQEDSILERPSRTPSPHRGTKDKPSGLEPARTETEVKLEPGRQQQWQGEGAPTNVGAVIGQNGIEQVSVKLENSGQTTIEADRSVHNYLR